MALEDVLGMSDDDSSDDEVEVVNSGSAAPPAPAAAAPPPPIVQNAPPPPAAAVKPTPVPIVTKPLPTPAAGANFSSRKPIPTAANPHPLASPITHPNITKPAVTSSSLPKSNIVPVVPAGVMPSAVAAPPSGVIVVGGNNRVSSHRSLVQPPSSSTAAAAVPPPVSRHPSATVNAAAAKSSSYVSSSSNKKSNTSNSGNVSAEEQARKEKLRKERFIMFTKVLIKYLENKDQNLHRKAKLVIKECADRNKRGDPEYKSLTASMQKHLKEAVGETYWKKAELYLEHYLRKKGPSSSSHPSSSKSHSMTEQHKAEAVKAAAYAAQKNQMANTNRPNSTIPKNSVPFNPMQQNPHMMAAMPPNMPPNLAFPGMPPKAVPIQNVSRSKSPAVDTKAPVSLGPANMESLDQNIGFVWEDIAKLVSKNHSLSAEVNLGLEQKQLLYGNRPGAQTGPLTEKEIDIANQFQGWSEKNILPAKIALAKVQLRESNNENVKYGYMDEDEARNDKTLMIISEAAQMFVKKWLNGAITSARQRQNVDAKRLWHRQHGSIAPPIALRLGCDVNRQEALSSASAANICKRMEEALSRRDEGVDQSKLLVDSETALNSSGLADLAKQVKIVDGVEQCDKGIKRHSNVFNGSETRNKPPFGSIPKRIKLEVHDFRNCAEDFKF